MIPEISIIVPTYNRAKTLVETINSVYTQSYSNWELLIIDDGSTDDTIQIVKQWIEKDARIHLIKNLKKGGNSCRNSGIENAKGKYLIFLDSDDLLLNDCLKKRAELITQNAALDFIVLPGAVFYDNAVTPSVYWNIEKKTENLNRFFLFDSPWQTSGPLWKKSFLADNQLQWDEKLMLWQDIDFHIAVLRKNPNYIVYWNNKVDYLIRGNSIDSLSRNNYNHPDKIASRIYFLEKYYKELENKPHDYAPGLLKILLIKVLSVFFFQKKYRAFYTTAKKGLKISIINTQDFYCIILNAFKAMCSFNRIPQWRFPNKEVTAMLQNENATLQKISVQKDILY